LPEISRFYGIVIRMFYRDHRPPHLHARYGDDEVTVTLDDAMRVEGRFPKRALALVLEWTEKNRAALLANWTKLEQREPLEKVPPLE